MDPKCYCKVTETETTVIAQVVKPVRKKVIIQDTYNSKILTFSLTQDQIDLVETLYELDLLSNFEWQITDEEDWKEI
jgi:hypothetical protein